MTNPNVDPTAFGKSKAEIGLIFNSISSRIDQSHPDADNGHDSLQFLEAGMEMLSKSNEAKATFGVFNA